MQYVIRNKFFYFFLAFATAALVPVMAEAQTTVDSGDGPTDVSVTTTTPTKKAKPEAKASEDTSTPTDTDSKEKPKTPDAAFIVGGGFSGGSPQYFGGTGTLGVQGSGARGTANITYAGADKAADRFSASADLWNIRVVPSSYSLEKGSYAPYVAGTAYIGTGSNGTAFATGFISPAAMTIPLGSKCMGLVGAGLGASVKKNAGSDNISTTAVGAGPGIGGWCQSGQFTFMTSNYAFVNFAALGSEASSTNTVSGQSKAGVWFQALPNLSVGAYGAVDYDTAEAKVTGRGGLELLGSFDITGDAPKKGAN